MRTEKIKTLKKKLDKKTGDPDMRFPNIVFQDCDNPEIYRDFYGKSYTQDQLMVDPISKRLCVRD